MSVRIGILGCGFIGLAHAFSLRALIDAHLVEAEIVLAHDMDSAKADALAGLVGARPAADAGAVVSGADAVWVCTPTSSHVELVRLVAASGRAVFCEKPVGRNLQEASEIVRVVADAGVPNQVGLVLRYAPVFRDLRAGMESGRFGRLMTVVFRDDQFLPVQGRYASTWRADVAVAGGGTLLEHSIHDLDVLQWLAGPVRSLTASTRYFSGHEGIEDLATVLLEFDGGPTASLTSAWHQVLSRASTRRVEVVSEDAVVWLENEWVGPLYVQTSKGIDREECPHPPWAGELRVADEVRDAVCVYAAGNLAFLEALRAGTAPSPGVHTALVAHRLVDAAYLSARLGRPVSPDSLST